MIAERIVVNAPDSRRDRRNHGIASQAEVPNRGQVGGGGQAAAQGAPSGALASGRTATRLRAERRHVELPSN